MTAPNMVEFEKIVTRALGKNGRMKCKGIYIMHNSSALGLTDTIKITPINSRDDIGPCYIEIPIEDLPGVINALVCYTDQHGRFFVEENNNI